MKIKIELLNLLTGFTLLLIGALGFYNQQYIGAAGWIIFGSMYLVMDNYKSNSVATTRLQKITQHTRPIFGWAGLIGAVLLLVYRLAT